MVDFDSLVDDSVAQAQPKAADSTSIPFDQLQDDSEKYGTGTEIAKTAIEQGLSGATLGASKVLETHLLGVKPEAIEARAAANPITSAVSNIAGTGALIAGTGGLGGIAEGAGLGARVGLGAAEGAGIGGITQANDDWSQNKPLDAQKIVASAGIGALLGTGGTLLGQAVSSKLAPKPLAQVPNAIQDQANDVSQNIAKASAAAADAPQEFKGVQPDTLEKIAERVNKAKQDNTAVSLPEQSELGDALSRVSMENPVGSVQFQSLENQEARDIYQTLKEAPGNSDIKDYEALQKNELLKKASETIQDISPGSEPISDAYQGGKEAIDAFTNQYQTEKNALSPVFKELKNLPIQGDILSDAIVHMTQAVPGIANMFDTTGAEIAIRPYKTAWGIDKATYNAVKEAVDSLKGEDDSLETLWNVRKGMDQHIDVLAQGQAPSEIRALKASLMSQMENATGNPTIRDTFKRYAINEQQRQVIEKSFGASVGSPEFGQISKVKPELIGDKIFGNTATVQAAKNILPPEQFQRILSNWLAEGKAAATDKGAFSSNKFASFLRRNQDALNIAFQDRPQQFQRLKDLTTIMRILPDAPSVNPSGTAKTLYRLIDQVGGGHTHNLTWEGLVAKAGQKVTNSIAGRLKRRDFNNFVSKQALQNSQASSLKSQVQKISDRIDSGIRTIFLGAAGQGNQKNEK